MVRKKGKYMQDFNNYKINEILHHKYYQIPQELFANPLYKDKLNSDSKLLYGFLLDRMSLSAKNNWTRKKYDSGVEQNTIQDAKNIRAINTNDNYTYINNKGSKNLSGYIGREYPHEFYESFYANV